MVGGSKEVQTFLERHESTTLKTAASLAEILRRPEMKYRVSERNRSGEAGTFVGCLPAGGD